MEEVREWEKDFAEKARQGVVYMHKTYAVCTWYMSPYLYIYDSNTISSKLNRPRTSSVQTCSIEPEDMIIVFQLCL